ncbi:hypothetical protein CCZ01_06520 [Helicobacter monodelphidis]|uniref:hypothetical protein n=1 Tax=Helicobacter sp. 15-1451 TaxID=2004995 RepID=UPI000DCC80E6|nr:hypothetical protein [Helicobacter sp. 15-1451]RAX57346.1 hypothetical protein CCZ01_06520 [Helicobacter sp. 15-1451]
MSLGESSRKQYHKEQLRAKRESEKLRRIQIQKQQGITEEEESPFLNITEDVVKLMHTDLDKECVRLLNPILDKKYKEEEVSITIQHEELLSMQDIIRFIHGILIQYLKKSEFKNHALTIILNRTNEEGKRVFQRIFEVISPPQEWGGFREGFSIVKTEGLTKKGIIDILIQPTNVMTKGLNNENFSYQLAILSDGKPHQITIANDLIGEEIFLSVKDSEHSTITFDVISLKRFFVGFGFFAFVLFIFIFISR